MRMNNKKEKKDTNENQFRSAKIELNLLHEAEMEDTKRVREEAQSNASVALIC